MRAANIDAEIDTLFQLPLGEFTDARNKLAARLKKEGRLGDAERVKALPKAPATAWAVNQLYWRHPKDVERLLAQGEKVRKAQTGGQASLRQLLDERRQLISDLTTRATAILREGGHGISPDAIRRVSITLESLASWGRTDGAPQAGRLTADLEPLGFDGLAALLGGKSPTPAKVLQFRQKKSPEDEAAARARTKEAVKAAEKALRQAQRDAERAEAALEKATARVEAVEKQKQEIDARYAQAREEARLASGEARKAAQELADAERALDRLRSG